MAKTKQLDLEAHLNHKPKLQSAYNPNRFDVVYDNGGPSLTRTEFTEECDINVIMKNYAETGVMPRLDGREPIYWDAESVPSNLQDAIHAMDYANSLFMQLDAGIRKEFDNDAVKFVQFAQDGSNKDQLKKWGLLAPETPVQAPVRVEVVPADNKPAPDQAIPPSPVAGDK